MDPDAPPSPWVERFASLVEPCGAVLDLACGAGRHTRLFLARGHPVTAVDRDLSHLVEIHSPALQVVETDLEDGRPWAGSHPLAGRSFAGVVVTNYLWRPTFHATLALVASGGLLLYETFAVGQERHGRPTQPEFLLRPGELLERVHPPDFRVLAYEDLTDEGPAGPAVRQRICARRA